MARALAFAQFLIVSLGVVTLHLLVKIDNDTAPVETMAVYAQFLARHALWLFAVPILYAGIGSVVESRGGAKAVQVAGIVLCIALMALVGLPICHHLF